MELKQIRAFMAVAQWGSFSKAAESMYLSQSALSKQIAALEDSMGARLFQRDKHAVRLTDAGRAFLPMAGDLLDRAEHATRLLGDLCQGAGPASVFRLGYEAQAAEEPFFRLPLLRCLAQFHRDLPQVQVDLFAESFAGLDQGVRLGRYDMGLSLRDLPPEQVFLDRQGCLICPVPLAVALPPGTSPGGGGPLDVLVHENDYRAVAQCLKVFPRFDVQPKFRYCGSTLSILAGVESGRGAALLPAQTARCLGPQIQRVAVAAETACSYLCAEWARDVPPTCQDQLADALRAAYAEQI